ncbi:MAG: sigma 54-interacting transcriptional regulator [Terriglobales bacterium]
MVCSSLRRITDYDYARLELLEPDGRGLQVRGCRTDDDGRVRLLEDRRIPIVGAISARAIETRRVTFHSTADLTKFGDHAVGEFRNSGVRSLCAVPLILGRRVLGAMIVGAIREKAFSPEDSEYLQQVGTQIAAAIQNEGNSPEATQPTPAKDQRFPEKRLPEGARAETGVDEIIGSSPALKRVLDYASVVALTDATVLVTGETGTGKERVARAIHRISPRRENAFIKLNCAAIPTGLLESELFGHEKGAFTGAVNQKIGRLELADRGTLLLDEVGEIPLELQPKLLRVLQDQEFERLGGTKTLRVDVRLIAASNRDLERAVEEKAFRADLFYRLHVFPLHLPALRERREDIPLLIRHFVEKSTARLRKRIDIIPDDAVEIMINWDWPGNIRELENFIERSVILSEDHRLCPPLAELREPLRLLPDSEGTLRDHERGRIIEILRQTGGVLSGPAGAATRLGLKRTTLQYKMQRLGISRHEYLD